MRGGIASLSYIAIGESIDKATNIEDLTRTMTNAIIIDEITVQQLLAIATSKMNVSAPKKNTL